MKNSLYVVITFLFVFLIFSGTVMARKGNEVIETEKTSELATQDGVFYVTSSPSLSPSPKPTVAPKKTTKTPVAHIKECTWSKEKQKKVYDICEKYSMSFDLCIAMAKQESTWNEKATGDSEKAYGAWQIHPAQWDDELKRWGYTWNDMYDLEKACEVYCRIMKAHFEKNDNVYFAIMAWRWGGSNAELKLNTTGPDAYAKKVIQNTYKYENQREGR